MSASIAASQSCLFQRLLHVDVCDWLVPTLDGNLQGFAFQAHECSKEVRSRTLGMP